MIILSHISDTLLETARYSLLVTQNSRYIIALRWDSPFSIISSQVLVLILIPTSRTNKLTRFRIDGVCYGLTRRIKVVRHDRRTPPLRHLDICETQ